MNREKVIANLSAEVNRLMNANIRLEEERADIWRRNRDAESSRDTKAAIIAELKDENESLRKDAELYRQIERAASDLPNGWEIRVCVEKDAGYAELYDPDGCEVDFPNSCETLALTVSDAIDAANRSPENP